MSRKNDLRQAIITYLREHPLSSSGAVFAGAGTTAAYATVKRALAEMVSAGLVNTTGKGKATRYSLHPAQDLLAPVDLESYFLREIDERTIRDSFNWELFRSVLPAATLFSAEERARLKQLQDLFREKTAQLSPEEFHREYERLAIDLSWKSSQIEGNTYSLLETERLLKEKETAAGKTRDEATMLLNHKAALDFLLEHPDYLQPLTLRAVEDVHSLLVRDLPVVRHIRQGRVGITGTNYRPLDNEHQIREAMEELCRLVNARTDVFEKALLVLLLLSYIQPFADGNKRTARIVSNALLMQGRTCSLSFRTVDALDYKKAMLVFYEQNNLSAFKKIFLEQCAFAVETYF